MSLKRLAVKQLTLHRSVMLLVATLVLGLTTALPAGAQDLEFQEYRRFLLSGDQGHKKLAIQTTCTTAEGEVHRIGEAAYDACLNSARQAAESKKGASEKSENVATPALGTTIHLGE